MQKLKRVFKFLFKTVCILVVLGICLNVYDEMTWKSRHHSHNEFTLHNRQLYLAFLDFYRSSDLEENDSCNFSTNEFKNLFEIKKLLLENSAEKDDIEKLREKSKYLYLNPNIDLWRQAVLYKPIFSGKEFEGENEIAMILCDPEGSCNNKFPVVSFSGRIYSPVSTNIPINTVPLDWLEPNAEAQKEWEAYERSLSEAGVK